MTLPKFSYRAPTSVEELVELVGEYGEDGLPVAGGTSVVVMLRERLVRPQALLSLTEIPELRRLESNGVLRLGAMVTHREIERSGLVRDFAPMLAQACGRVGSPAIRNMGTLCGNIAHGDSASDPAPALIALGAEAVVQGPGGERRLALDSFFKGFFDTERADDEVLTAIEVPPAAAGSRHVFHKFTTTSAEAFALVTVSVSVVPAADGSCADLAIGLGSVGPAPLRAHAAEAVLRGQAVNADSIAAAAEAAVGECDPTSDSQGSADYRRQMTRVWLRRCLAQAFEQTSQP
ncbi:MAG TPA: xanthine dehydrogenase family protein subunit M [Alphaproteobacteria bacterium]|jgi:carbon-monoxide dehydrogenase medium subunit|nr:xanthine dehydrogenase family protein subunit M [Alphaproteobacteria bacterium]MDP6271800.1 xanthine dehydrogenase family protein subunit M [Alphaproteobacteria bacterium]MDP7165146.1 xanthine dehydrogenase family protein subunit M [Alphaproteobacteria bacterium]HJM51212.1 xanthine dehydrogenase family protein subunit M [Alphaproteobacteria bacterium]